MRITTLPAILVCLLSPCLAPCFAAESAAADLPAALVRLARPPVVDGDAGNWRDVTAAAVTTPDSRSEVGPRVDLPGKSMVCVV